jgi:hypothetical protein
VHGILSLLDSFTKRKNAVWRLAGVGVCAWALTRAGSSFAAAAVPTSADTGIANYAFASELGSGVYEINGRTIQVYQFSPSYRLRYAERPRARPGMQLIFPLTVGFFNFQPQDLVHLDIPTQIGALSLEPGIEFDYWLNEDWHLYPFIKAGATFASSSAVNAYIYGTGIRSDYHFSLFEGTDLWREELNYAGVHYRSNLPNDSFTRLRTAAELRQGVFSAPFKERRIEVGVYGIGDIYLNAPTGPASGISARTLQFETGLMIGMNPVYRFKGISLPRLGIGYRDAGMLSGWRLVIGEPF